MQGTRLFLSIIPPPRPLPTATGQDNIWYRTRNPLHILDDESFVCRTYADVIQAQVVAYTVLILDAKPQVGAEYSIYSVSLAMFLMLSISSSDIWTSYMLLRWGGSFFRCLFGALLLGCTALLVVASLKVLFMHATTNSDLVLGATTVLFIEDVVRKINYPEPDSPMQGGEVPKEMFSNSKGKRKRFLMSSESFGSQVQGRLDAEPTD